MNLTDYFNPIDEKKEDYIFSNNPESLLYNITKHTSANFEFDIDKFDIAIFSIPEDRNSDNIGSAEAGKNVRKQFYKLYKPFLNIRIIDLGELKQGKTVKDTYALVKYISEEILSKNTVLLMIGGTQDLAYPIYQAYKKHFKSINICSIDARFDFGNSENDFDSKSYLNKIILEKNSKLFNYTNLGYQSYYVAKEEINLMNELYFDAVRLGESRTYISNNEPYIRDSDFLMLDVSSIKRTDAPAHATPSIHGYYGEEMCQLAKYAGMSDRLSSFGIFEMNPKFDNRNQTSELVAQIMWHFIQGYYLRQKEYPKENLKKYKKYIVAVQDFEHKIVFYKSEKTGRLWMEVPYLQKDKQKIIIIPCSDADYKEATKNNLPARWWKIYQKLN